MTVGTTLAVLDPAPPALPMDGYELHDVEGLNSVGHLFPKSKSRSGIYVLTFRNGDRYVGRSVDVVARFAAHRRNHGDDLVGLAFRRVRQARLAEAEKAEIWRFEDAGMPLRNIIDVTEGLFASDLDTLVSPREQATWLASRRQRRPDTAERPDRPALRHRQATRYADLASDRDFPGIGRLLGRYVRCTMPFPARTELTHWSLSATPSTNQYSRPRLFTLSVQVLETLFASYGYHDHDDLRVRMNVDAATLLETWGTLERLTGSVPDVDARMATYPARRGVAALTAYAPEDAEALLSVPGVSAAARRLNLDLMRKGPTMHWRTHCFDLADHIYR